MEILRLTVAVILWGATCFLLAAFVYVLYYNLKITLLRRLEYRREFSVQGVFEGGELVITETIYNNSPLPIFFVDIESYIHRNLKLVNYADYEDYEDEKSAMQLIISRFHLPPYTEVKRRHTVRCARRGYYKMNTACVISKGKAVYFNFEAELYVYPKVIELRQTAYPVNLLQGDSQSRRRVMQDPFSVSGVRDYAVGDPFNMINFKATAKSGFQGVHGIKVNKLDYCSDRIFMIYINFQLPEMGIPTDEYEAMMETALSFAASFISEALLKGYRVGFAANCRSAIGGTYVSFPIIGGAHHVEEILRELAKAQTACGMSFSAMLERGSQGDIYNTEIFVITPYVDESIDDSVAVFKRRGNAVTIMEL